MQILPSTWKLYSKEIYGEVRTQTKSHERYVAYKMIEKWLAQGHDAVDIAKIWNQGHTGQCSAGVNKYGAKYDSCAYINAVLAQL